MMLHNSSHTPQQPEVTLQYGRYYGFWRPRKYLFPIDEEALDAMDLFHKFFVVARKNALYLPDLDQNRSLRVMDLGTGTGIWSIVVADRLYGRTGHQPVVMAVDLHKFQSRLIPPGMTTVQFDIEDLSWNSLITGCDLVHIRLLFGSIHHEMWPEIYRRIFHHLTPGSGYVEHVEIDWVPRWDKYTMPQASALKEWSDRFLGALDRFNRSARVDSTAVHRTIEGAGFTNFREEIIRCYVNPWMSDPHEQDVANWFNIAFSRGVDAMSFVPMIEGLGMSQSKVQDLCTRVKKEICVLAHHAYFDIHIWSARRSPD